MANVNQGASSTTSEPNEQIPLDLDPQGGPAVPGKPDPAKLEVPAEALRHGKDALSATAGDGTGICGIAAEGEAARGEARRKSPPQ